MRFRFINIVDNFSVLLPETQVLGIEALRNDCMPNEHCAKMLDPMLNALLSNKTIVTMKKKTWVSLLGMTYYAPAGSKNTNELHHHIKSMCNIVKTKAGPRRTGPRRRRSRTPEPPRRPAHVSEDEDEDEDDEEVGGELIQNVDVLMAPMEGAVVDRPVITVDDSKYGTAITLWVMTNYAISMFYHGTGTLVEHWTKGGFGIQALRNLFTSPVTYYRGTAETIAYVIPELQATHDHVQSFIDSGGEAAFPFISGMTPDSIMGAMGTARANTPSQVKADLEKVMYDLASADMVAGMPEKVNSLVSLAVSSRPNLDNPGVLLRYTKMWLHYKPVNFLSSCTQILYNVVPKETVDAIGLYATVQSKHGATVAAAALYEALPDRIIENSEELANYAGIFGDGVVKTVKSMGNGKHVEYLKQLSDDPKVLETIKVIREGIDLRRTMGYRKLADISERTVAALFVFIPSLFSFALVAFKLVYGILKLVGVVKKTEPTVHRSFRQKLGRGILDGLDFMNMSLLCAQSSLELLAMANVMQGNYRIDEITGTKSHYFFYTTLTLQLIANSLIRERYGITESESMEWFLEGYNAIIWGVKEQNKLTKTRVRAILGAGQRSVNTVRWGVGQVCNGITAGAANVGQRMLTDRAVYQEYQRRRQDGNWEGAEQTMSHAKTVPIFQDLVKIHTYMAI